MPYSFNMCHVYSLKNTFVVGETVETIAEIIGVCNVEMSKEGILEVWGQMESIQRIFGVKELQHIRGLLLIY